MKKNWLILLMLCIVALALTACSSPEQQVGDEPTATPAPTETGWVPDPTITPRPMDGAKWPSEDATLLLIDPVDKPTPAPIATGDYRSVESDAVGLSFKIPNYWEEVQFPGEPKVEFREPDDRTRSGLGVSSFILITVETHSTAQTKENAGSRLDEALNALRAEYPSLEFSSKSDQRIMASDGYYATVRFDKAVEGTDETIKMRGRYVAIPKDKKVYLFLFAQPAEYNDYYDTAIYKEFRSSVSEL